MKGGRAKTSTATDRFNRYNLPPRDGTIPTPKGQSSNLLRNSFLSGLESDASQGWRPKCPVRPTSHVGNRSFAEKQQDADSLASPLTVGQPVRWPYHVRRSHDFICSSRRGSVKSKRKGVNVTLPFLNWITSADSGGGCSGSLQSAQ